MNIQQKGERPVPILIENFRPFESSIPVAMRTAIKLARRNLKITQRELAEATNVSRYRIRGIENGDLGGCPPIDMFSIFEYLKLPKPNTFQDDESLPPKIKRAIAILRRQGAHLTEAGATFVDSAVTMAITAMDPTIVIPRIDTDKSYVGNNAWMWQMRPFATHLFQRLRKEVKWDRLTVQRTLYVRTGAEVATYPETYTQGVANYLLYLNKAISDRYGADLLETGGTFDLGELNSDISSAMAVRGDSSPHIMLVNIERNRQLVEGSQSFRGTVKLFLYRDGSLGPFSREEWEIVRNETEQYFAEVDNFNETLRK